MCPAPTEPRHGPSSSNSTRFKAQRSARDSVSAVPVSTHRPNHTPKVSGSARKSTCKRLCSPSMRSRTTSSRKECWTPTWSSNIFLRRVHRPNTTHGSHRPAQASPLHVHAQPHPVLRHRLAHRAHALSVLVEYLV